MNCKSVRDLLTDYMDGRLDETNLDAVKGHISMCAECSMQLKELRGVSEALRGLESVKAPADFTQKLNERINARSRSFFQSVPLMFKIPAGALALVMTAVIAAYVFKSEQVLPPVVQEKRAEIASIPSKGDLSDKPSPPVKSVAEAPATAGVELHVKAKRPQQHLKQPEQEQRKDDRPVEKPGRDHVPVSIALLIKVPTSVNAPSAAMAAPAPNMADTSDKMSSIGNAGGNAGEEKKGYAVTAERAKSKESAVVDSIKRHEPLPVSPTEAPGKKNAIDPLDSAMSKIVDMLPELGAKVAVRQAGHRLQIEIPSEHYDTFLQKLQSIGQSTALNDESRPRSEGAKTFLVQIELVSE